MKKWEIKRDIKRKRLITEEGKFLNAKDKMKKRKKRRDKNKEMGERKILPQDEVGN